MESYTSQSPLLNINMDDSFEETQYTNTAMETADTDSSSGYDSSDFSEDDDSFPVKKPAPRPEQHANGPVTMRFQNRDTLCGDLSLILNMPEMCDVTFLVGPAATPIHGVRAIMATRSRVFYQLILKHLHIRQSLQQQQQSRKRGTKTVQTNSLTDRLTIPVKKYDDEVFRMLIQFVHSGSITITDTTVLGLLCASIQFQLQDLEQACRIYLADCLSASGCGEHLLPSGRFYGRFHAVARDLVRKIHALQQEKPLITFPEESTV